MLVLCLAGGLMMRGRSKDGLLLVTVAVTPMLLWRGYVGWTLFPDFGYHGFLDHPLLLTVPFRGLAELWQAVGAGEYADHTAAMARAGTTYPLLLGAALIVSAVLALRVASALTIAALAYAVMAVSLNYEQVWLYVGSGQRGTSPSGSGTTSPT